MRSYVHGQRRNILRAGILPGVTLDGGGVTTPQVRMVGECGTHAFAGLSSKPGAAMDINESVGWFVREDLHKVIEA